MNNYVELYFVGWDRSGTRRAALRIKDTSIDLIKNLDSKDIDTDLMTKLTYESSCLIPNETFVTMIFKELESFSQIEETYKIYDLISFIASVNRDIVLDNLRRLYDSLRIEVRRYRRQI